MTLYSLCGVAFISVSAVLLIKEYGGKTYALVLTGIALIFIATFVLSRMGQVLGELSFLSSGGVSNPYYETLLKSFGVAFVSEISSDSLRELGSENIGKWIELAGKSEIIILSLPIIKDLLEKSFSLM